MWYLSQNHGFYLYKGTGNLGRVRCDKKSPAMWYVLHPRQEKKTKEAETRRLLVNQLKLWSKPITYSCIQGICPDDEKLAMASVNVLTIQKWEHCMIRWMDAYRDGKGTKAAQIQVKKFGSRKQTSHGWVSETVAHAFD